MTTIRLQKTGYYVTSPDGSMYRDGTGKIWFSKDIARQLAREIGGWYEQGSRITIKEVVVAL